MFPCFLRGHLGGYSSPAFCHGSDSAVPLGRFISARTFGCKGSRGLNQDLKLAHRFNRQGKFEKKKKAYLFLSLSTRYEDSYLIYTTQVYSAFGAPWLASSEVIIQVYSPSSIERGTKL